MPENAVSGLPAQSLPGAAAPLLLALAENWASRSIAPATITTSAAKRQRGAVGHTPATSARSSSEKRGPGHALETLNSLRLLSNLETEKRKLLQIVLFGHSRNSTANWRSRRSRQLFLQRIAFHYRLSGLSRQGRSATTWRTACGWPATGGDERVLLRRCVSSAQASWGTPRLLNILAHKSCSPCLAKAPRRTGGARPVAAADTEDPARRLVVKWA